MYASELRRGIPQQRATGKYRALASAMMSTNASPPPATESSSDVVWPVTMLGNTTFTVSGPTSKVALFKGVLAKMSRFDDTTTVQYASEQLWPIFILSRGRSTSALLHWGAEHVLGAARVESVVVVVVSPEEYASYRDNWPSELFMILPSSDGRLGYARHIVKQAFEWRLPFLWMADDNLTAFTHIQGRSVEDTDFRAAFLHAQTLPVIGEAALVGFLRANGTEAAKTNPLLVDNAKIYKCFLLNTVNCRGVDYIPGLAKHEDIAFAYDLQCAGRRLLKVQSYAYHVKMLAGGCDMERRQQDSTCLHWPRSQLAPAELRTVEALEAWLENQRQLPAPKSLRQNKEVSLAVASNAAPNATINVTSTSSKQLASYPGKPPDGWRPSQDRPVVRRRLTQLLHRRIKVWWEDDGCWYCGTVRRWSNCCAYVHYDDGERRWEALMECFWDVVSL